MKERKITEEEFVDLSERDESHFFELKDIRVSGKTIQKTAVAFANADGGEIIIGIKDKKEEKVSNRRWCGAKSREEFNSVLQSLFDLNPSLDLRFEFISCEDKEGYILRVNIEKSTQVCKTSDSTVYVRQGAQSLLLKDPQKISELSYAKGSKSYEDDLLTDLLPEQIVDNEPIKTFLEDVSPKSDPLEFCSNQNLVDYSTWVPRVCSALLFHPSPSTVMPKKCSVKIIRYETKEKIPEREHLTKNITVEGPLYSLIHETIENIINLMESVSIHTEEGLKRAKYPPEAIEEILVNAVIHRDYAISDDIKVLRIQLVSATG